MATPNTCPQHAADIAQRIANAHDAFAQVLMDRGGLNQADAVNAMRTLLRLKVAKLDLGGGRINVSHGMYLEPDVIRNAASLK